MRLASLAGGLAVLVGAAALAAPGDPLVVNGDAVNVRSEPSTNSRIWVRARRGEPVIELAREGDWVRVALPEDDTEGWIHGSLLAPAPGAGASGPATAASVPAAPAPSPPERSEPPLATSHAPTATAPVAKPAVIVESPAVAAVVAPAAGPDDVAAAQGAAEAAANGTAVAALGAPDDAIERFRASVTYINDRALAAAGVDLFTAAEPQGAGAVRVTTTEAWRFIPEAGHQSYLSTLFDRWLAAAGGTGPLRLEIVDPSGQVVAEKSGP